MGASLEIAGHWHRRVQLRLLGPPALAAVIDRVTARARALLKGTREENRRIQWILDGKPSDGKDEEEGLPLITHPDFRNRLRRFTAGIYRREYRKRYLIHENDSDVHWSRFVQARLTGWQGVPDVATLLAFSPFMGGNTWMKNPFTSARQYMNAWLEVDYAAPDLFRVVLLSKDGTRYLFHFRYDPATDRALCLSVADGEGRSFEAAEACWKLGMKIVPLLPSNIKGPGK